MSVITHTFVGLKCLTETKIQILCDHVDHTRFHIVEMGCQMVQLLSAHIVGPTMFVNLTPAYVDVLLLMLGKLRFCKSFQSGNYVYYDLTNSALDFLI